MTWFLVGLSAWVLLIVACWLLIDRRLTQPGLQKDRERLRTTEPERRDGGVAGRPSDT